MGKPTLFTVKKTCKQKNPVDFLSDFFVYKYKDSYGILFHYFSDQGIDYYFFEHEK